jgi:hypothetical protein
VTSEAHTAAMNAPLDYRTRVGREAEVLAQISIDGGLTYAWLSANSHRATALDRMVRAGRVRIRYPIAEGALLRYEIVQAASPSVWQRLVRWFAGEAN